MKKEKRKETILLPGDWYLVKENERGPHYNDWFLSDPNGIWVAKFWDGPVAGEQDAYAFAKSIKIAFKERQQQNRRNRE